MIKDTFIILKKEFELNPNVVYEVSVKVQKKAVPLKILLIKNIKRRTLP